MAETKLAMIVLAGGASSRMGREKSDLLLNGRTFLETQIAKGKQLGVNRIYVSGYHGEGCTEEIVMDRTDVWFLVWILRWSRYRNCIILFRQLNMKA